MPKRPRKILIAILLIVIVGVAAASVFIWWYTQRTPEEEKSGDEAIPSCGSHFLTKVSYRDDRSTPEEAEKTSIFTTEDDSAICRVYEPINWYELQFVWYDPHGNSVPPRGGITVYYENGIAYCAEAFFNISGEDRELGQYRVECSARKSEYEFQYYPLFTDYFQIGEPVLTSQYQRGYL